MVVPLPLFVGHYGFAAVGRGVPVLAPGRRAVGPAGVTTKADLAAYLSGTGTLSPIFAQKAFGYKTAQTPSGLAEGEGITLSEGVGHMLLYIGASALSIALGYAVRALTNIGITDIIPGLPYLPPAIITNLGSGVHPWMWVGWAGPVPGIFH